MIVKDQVTSYIYTGPVLVILHVSSRIQIDFRMYDSLRIEDLQKDDRYIEETRLTINVELEFGILLYRSNLHQGQDPCD